MHNENFDMVIEKIELRKGVRMLRDKVVVKLALDDQSDAKSAQRILRRDVQRM